MQAVAHTATIVGVEAREVEVQVDVSSGLPTFQIVGLGDAAVQEARERVRAAIRASGFDFPSARVIVNLAPAPLRKHGTGFDLPIALALLVATGQVPRTLVQRAAVVGELALDGTVRPMTGMLAHALAAQRSGRVLLGPAEGVAHIVSVDGLEYEPIQRLTELRTQRSAAHKLAPAAPARSFHVPDLSEVVGQETAKRVLEISAAGGHNLLFCGPPGSGKTMLARRLPGILPTLGETERFETALVHSVAGLDESPALAGIRPFRAPHHTASVASLVGGGSPPRPGEASLAHNGVLFLDELPEFGPAALQTLRQPLEDRIITLVRVDGRITYPAAFTLVAAMNPCPCGYHGDPERPCECSAGQVSKYQARVGGPLMDRVDLAVTMSRIDPKLLLTRGSEADGSAAVRDRVMEARERASARRDSVIGVNNKQLLTTCRLSSGAADYLTEAARRFCLSGRAVTRVLRVGRTIADLAGADAVGPEHLMEAVGYRAWETT